MKYFRMNNEIKSTITIQISDLSIYTSNNSNPHRGINFLPYNIRRYNLDKFSNYL